MPEQRLRVPLRQGEGVCSRLLGQYPGEVAGFEQPSAGGKGRFANKGIV